MLVKRAVGEGCRYALLTAFVLLHVLADSFGRFGVAQFGSSSCGCFFSLISHFFRHRADALRAAGPTAASQLRLDNPFSRLRRFFVHFC